VGRHRRAPGRGRLAIAVALAVLAAGSLGAGVHLLRREAELRAPDIGALPTAVSSAAPTSPQATRLASTPAPRPRPRATTPTRAEPPPAPPQAVAIPAAGVSAPVVVMGVRPDGELRVPESPRVVGWWVGSAPAGSPDATTLLAGHVDSAAEGVGALAALRDLGPGARIELTDVFTERHAYRVVARRTYPKYALPDDVFAVRGRARLVLVTCGGPFDESAGRYRDNVVVYAVPS
jgi:hypothetical protein